MQSLVVWCDPQLLVYALFGYNTDKPPVAIAFPRRLVPLASPPTLTSATSSTEAVVPTPPALPAPHAAHTAPVAPVRLRALDALRVEANDVQATSAASSTPTGDKSSNPLSDSVRASASASRMV